MQGFLEVLTTNPEGPLIDAFHTEVLWKNPIEARVLCFVYHSRIVMRYFAAGGS